jgi:hypothetical protein
LKIVAKAILIGGKIQIKSPGDSDKSGTTWSVTLQGNAITPRGIDFVSSTGQFEGADGILRIRLKRGRSRF